MAPEEGGSPHQAARSRSGPPHAPRAGADFGRAEATYKEMLELSRELGDKGNVATALNSLGTIAVQQGNSEQARALLQENMGVL